MRYWLYLAGKLAVLAVISYGLLSLVEHWFPIPPPSPRFGRQPLFLHDMSFTLAVISVWFCATGLFSLTMWDQRRRCRVCLRRLIMPIATGSWSNMLTFGRPRTEWICPYGHGTLKIADLQITGKESPDWEPNDTDMWKELESLGPRHK